MSRAVADVTDGVTGSIQYATTQPTGGNLPGGRGISSLFTIHATGKAGTAVTGVKVGLVGSHSGAVGTWVPLLCYLASDAGPTRTARQLQTISVSASSISYDAIMTEDTRGWGYLAIAYQTAGGDMASGDRLQVWQEGI